MDTEIPEGTIPDPDGLPLDIRIVARLFYAGGGLLLLTGILLCCGVVKPGRSVPVFFHALVLSSGVDWGVYTLFKGCCWWFYDWGLRRGIRFVWWWLMISSVYYLIRGILVLADYPTTATIGLAVEVAFVAWLWFRRGFYGFASR